jgi:hypothetical protein
LEDSPNSFGLLKVVVESDEGVYIKYLTEVQVGRLQSRGLLGVPCSEGSVWDALPETVEDGDDGSPDA